MNLNNKYENHRQPDSIENRLHFYCCDFVDVETKLWYDDFVDKETKNLGEENLNV